MKIKVSETTPLQLNYLVAKCEGWVDYPEDSIERGSKWHCDPEKAPFGKVMWKSNFQPSTDWAQGGVILEREKITVGYERYGAQGGETWDAVKKAFDDTALWLEYGPTPLIAAMRCHVASKLGDEVDVPEELAALVKGE